MKLRKSRILAILLAVSMLAAMLTGCGDDKNSGQAEKVESSTQVVLESGETVTVEEPTPAESYEALYNTLIAVQSEASEIYEIREQLALSEEPLSNAEVVQYGKPDFSDTAVTPGGVEAAELIIADGGNIYMVCSSELVIVSADGENTRELGRTFVTGTIPDGYAGSEAPKAIYHSGNSIYVVTYEYLYQSQDTEEGYAFDNSELVHVKQFDISDPTAPTLVSDYAQSGNYLNSYVVDDMLYLIGAYSVWMPEEDDLTSYVPYTMSNGEDTVLDAGSVYICPGLDSTDYTVISAYDMKNAELANATAVTGYNVWNVTDGKNLFLGRTSYDYDLSESYKKDQYQVNDLSHSANTELLRMTLDSSLEITANACVAGYLHEQSAMALGGEELYLATTCSGYTCQIFHDETYGFTNYLAGDRISGNAAYALDKDLNILRTLDDLGDGEDVYEVRLDGAMAYVIGSENLTPITQADLSAKNPKVKKFSAAGGEGHFLYDVGDGLVAGIGVKESDDGAVTGLNLSVYRSESDGMELLDNMMVTESWNGAMQNSRTVLTLPEKNLIAIPAETNYHVYSLKNGETTELGVVEMGYVSGDARLMQIGELLYFCNDAAIVVVDAAEMTPIARCDFAYG